MIGYSTRARIAGDLAEAMAWARQATDLVNRITGTTGGVAMRVGGGLEVLWHVQVDSMAALETLLETSQSHPEYLALIKTAMDKGLWDTSSIESFIWKAF